MQGFRRILRTPSRNLKSRQNVVILAYGGDYPERALFHWAKLYSSALPSGDDYQNMPRTVIISILDFNLFECAEFHSEFRPLEATRHEPLSDRMRRQLEKARLTEASALRRAAERERMKLQTVVAGKDAENERLRAEIEKLRTGSKG